MSKALVIVESLAKAKTINKYLGKDYIVKSSIGHVRDLVTNVSLSQKNTRKNKKSKLNTQHALIDRMGIDPFHGWKAKYEILPGKEQIVTELKALAKKVDHIYLATDLDREGEAIAWHLREIIGGSDERFSRVIFNEITRSAIREAFKTPKKLNLSRVHAQQARRFMDRIVGYMLSPLLWKKVARGLSAGRVQSVAVRLIVEREREIKTFIPKDNWELHANLLTIKSNYLTMQVTHQKKKPFKPTSQKQIQEAIYELEHAHYVVSSCKNKSIISNPVKPFITSTLQQTANIYLGYGIKKTMLLAQRLYEAGYITYMRTDSTHLSKDAINMARDYINSSFEDSYLPKKPNKFNSKKNVQEAHEAIRPSDIRMLSEQLKDMPDDAQKLYKLIWSQFIACQMTPAQYDSTILTVTAGNFQLLARGRILRFDGWTKIMPIWYKIKEDQIIPTVEIGEILKLVKLIPSKSFTKPPVRYSEASLVKELEKRGIGRPSTYVSIITNIQDRGYIHMKNRRFYADKIGEIVTDRLEENFHELMNYDFTVNMENALDKVAKNQQEWKSVLDLFFNKFKKQLENAEKDPEDGGMLTNQMVITDIDCLNCGRKMGIRTASTGVFLGCEGYILDPKKRCKNTINLIHEVDISNFIGRNTLKQNTPFPRQNCWKCGVIMDSYIIDSQHKLHICGNNPLCDGYKIEKGEFHIQGFDGVILKCEKCDNFMQLKLGRFGKYVACSNKECKNTRKILQNGRVAPPKEEPVLLPELPCNKSDAYFVLRNGAKGIFLAANTFPKSRETRSPLVSELVRFRERLPERLRYLADAPVEDDEGNNTLVRFNLKTQQQYVSSEKKCKSGRWSAFYTDGQWQVRKK